MSTLRYLSIVLLILICSPSVAREETLQARLEQLEKSLVGLWRTDYAETKKYIRDVLKQEDVDSLTHDLGAYRGLWFKGGQMAIVDYAKVENLNKRGRYVITAGRDGVTYVVTCLASEPSQCSRVSTYKDFLIFSPGISSKKLVLLKRSTDAEIASFSKARRLADSAKEVWKSGGFAQQEEGVAPAEGVITLDGKPLAGVYISMSNSMGNSTAVSDAQGKFKMQYARGGKAYDGVLVGNGKVVIAITDDSSFSREGELEKPKSLIPAKYNNPATSGLRLVIPKEGRKRIALELESD